MNIDKFYLHCFLIMRSKWWSGLRSGYLVKIQTQLTFYIVNCCIGPQGWFSSWVTHLARYSLTKWKFLLAKWHRSSLYPPKHLVTRITQEICRCWLTIHLPAQSFIPLKCTSNIHNTHRSTVRRKVLVLLATARNFQFGTSDGCIVNNDAGLNLLP